MLGHFCLAELNFGNLLNKIEFTFEVVPCLILGFSDDSLQMCINFSPALQGGEWVGGGDGRVWVGVGREEAKTPR